MKARHTGSGHTLDEAMEHVFELKDWPALVAYLQKVFYFWHPTEQNVTSQFYATDERIGWRTHLVCIDGKAALYTDGHPDGIPDSQRLPDGREPIY